MTILVCKVIVHSIPLKLNQVLLAKRIYRYQYNVGRSINWYFSSKSVDQSSPRQPLVSCHVRSHAAWFSRAEHQHLRMPRFAPLYLFPLNHPRPPMVSGPYSFPFNPLRTAWWAEFIILLALPVSGFFKSQSWAFSEPSLAHPLSALPPWRLPSCSLPLPLSGTTSTLTGSQCSGHRGKALRAAVRTDWGQIPFLRMM